MTIIGMRFILLKSSCLFDSPVREDSLSVYFEGTIPCFIGRPSRVFIASREPVCGGHGAIRYD